ncbi:hypothetical protein SeMB42_g06653 [Synchytrium endobioticum]|uniref:Mediator of RNA polymerase II transcription subunit 18 n=1 Tax=Synchytrium endobioticum TaxID=286115 RepID=A0A507CAI5_9FUNG|nr:hypothetical protein SeMB42_g06653 [Synchytrium endobioticum]TPX48910.1 hypothetical protein SeLEV6574_g01762 [Synchytrium endobioticum]
MTTSNNATQFQCFVHGLLPDKSLQHVLQRLQILAGNFDFDGDCNLYEHEIVWHPKVLSLTENRKRSDDTVLRIRASSYHGQNFIKEDRREWKLFTQSRPEPPVLNTDRVRTWNQRAVMESNVEGDIFAYLDMLGYQPAFEYVRRGYQLPIDALRVCIYRLYKLTLPRKASSAVPLDDSLEPPWVVEVTSPLTNAMGTTNMGIMIDRLSGFIRGLVDLIAVDHVAFDNKIKYS